MEEVKKEIKLKFDAIRPFGPTVVKGKVPNFILDKVNKNIKKLTIKNKLLEDIEAQNMLLNSIVNDLAYIVAEVNQAYVQVTSAIADVKEERD